MHSSLLCLCLCALWAPMGVFECTRGRVEYSKRDIEAHKARAASREENRFRRGEKRTRVEQWASGALERPHRD